MKGLLFFGISMLMVAGMGFSYKQPGKPNTVKLNCDQIPELNQLLLNYVKSNLNKKVGRGECWDLAAQGLNTIGASWDKQYGFGKPVNIKKDCIYPGDIIQFKNVEIQYQKKDTYYREEMEHHTAIVFKVKDQENFVMAEQNTSSHGKKVGLSTLSLKNILKGSYTVYRPVK